MSSSFMVTNTMNANYESESEAATREQVIGDRAHRTRRGGNSK